MTAVRTDVLVVGGGPAGATTAFQLATAGISVTLVDRATFPRDKPCGESLSPGALARLDALSMWRPRGPAEASPEAPPMVVRGMRIHSPRGTCFLGRYKGGAGGLGLAIRRTRFDHELLACAKARGVRVIEGVEVTAAEITSSDQALVHARVVEGSAKIRFEARRVVVADGRRSFLARSLGFLEPEASGGDRRYAVGAHLEGVSGLSEFAEMHVGGSGYCGVAPLSPTTANVCYVLFTNRLDMTPRTMESDFRRRLRSFGEISQRAASSTLAGDIRVVGPLRLSSFKHATGPFIACGDTTGFLDPFTGEGIAHAIGSGVLGAAAISASLSGRQEAFRTYERDVRRLRRVKGMAARLLYALVSRPILSNSTATVLAHAPRLADAIVQLFGDQV